MMALLCLPTISMLLFTQSATTHVEQIIAVYTISLLAFNTLDRWRLEKTGNESVWICMWGVFLVLQMSEGSALETAILYSSIAAVIGPAGSANYAAANAAVDALSASVNARGNISYNHVHFQKVSHQDHEYFRMRQNRTFNISYLPYFQNAWSHIYAKKLWLLWVECFTFVLFVDKMRRVSLQQKASLGRNCLKTILPTGKGQERSHPESRNGFTSQTCIGFRSGCWHHPSLIDDFER